MVKNELEVEEVDEIVETKDEEGNDLTDWKALALKNQGIAKRFKTKLEKAKEAEKIIPEKKSEPEKKEEKKDFDNADYAYLAVKGYETDEEIAFIKGELEKTGKTLREILNYNYVQEELKSIKDEKAAKDATPKGSKRTGGASAKDDVDYWLAKGDEELPPSDQRELRRKVVLAREQRDRKANKFSSGGGIKIV